MHEEIDQFLYNFLIQKTYSRDSGWVIDVTWNSRCYKSESSQMFDLVMSDGIFGNIQPQTFHS